MDGPVQNAEATTPSTFNVHDDTKSNDQAESTTSEKVGLFQSIRQRATDSISHEDSTIPLAWQALLTGLVDALIYSRSQIWTGFQTGNMVQFSQNIAQFILPNAEKFPLLTLERSLSVSSFICGSFLGGKLGDRFGHSKRGWVAFSAFIQSCLLFGAAIMLLCKPEDMLPTIHYWPPIIVMTSLSMGMQSVSAQKLSSPAFATTVAFTATLTQIASDPFLFHLSLAPVEKARRDRRMFGIFMLCTGAGIAECFLYSRAGLRGGMTIAASFKMVQAILWFTAPRGQPVTANAQKK
ncbi:uncharacterized protein FA14DRAFT_150510 [Meira miltonrushii]|uniref:DUF1275 domain protein n=1 Tax=Meira miltonrushii TaxID=1280837 RepID=A0A316V3S9_9BASI|nr:uncharacterized protein FA14DRAFT_150510 [Meira miltonrushii]PWN32206.1 hypothetical protein FA14DRAFT_150510 [Meira miltonrushii]